MKKLVLIFLVAFSITALFACKGDKNPEKTDNTTESTTASITESTKKDDSSTLPENEEDFGELRPF